MPFQLLSTVYRLPTSRSRRAFTLIELLIVIAIVSLLTSVSAAAFNSFNRRQQLSQAQKNLDSILHDAQTRALSSVSGLHWGIHLGQNTNSVTLFSTASSYNARSTTISRDLESGIIVSDLTLSSSNLVNIIFSVVNGSVIFTADNGTCLGGSADSSCAFDPDRCLAIGVNLQGTGDKRYLKVNERNIFASATLPCSFAPI